MLAEFNWEVLFVTPFGFITVAVIGGIIASIISTMMGNWRKVRVAEQQAALKQTMIDKGMSAADIERVLTAGTKGGDSKRC
jgi:hypothetical protein